VCSAAGAYNTAYRYWIVEANGDARPARFAFGAGASSIAYNTVLSPDGRRIETFVKDRGIGDCGVIASFAWDGRALRLTDEADMPECRGISPDDWPHVYRARVDPGTKLSARPSIQ